MELGGSGDTPAIVGALYHPDDGHIAPADLTMALRKGARSRRRRDLRADRGARLRADTVRRMEGPHHQGRHRRPSTSCCATGNYARQTGRMFGLNVPAIPVEHQYIVYDQSPELKAYRTGGGRELAVLRESDQSYYLREERMGWILGPYEKGAPARFADGVPDWFGRSLFPGDLERLLPHVEAAQRRVPSLENCGIKDIVNGPISYTPDGSPLIGPAWDLPNVWLNEGHSFGITAAGGSGWQLAEWIVEGEPGIDMLAVDPRRYRRLHEQALRRHKERGDLSQRLHHSLPGRRARRRTSCQDEPGVRQDRSDGRRLGPALWLGARQLVCAAGCRAQGPLELPPHELLRARRQRSAA